MMLIGSPLFGFQCDIHHREAVKNFLRRHQVIVKRPVGGARLQCGIGQVVGLAQVPPSAGARACRRSARVAAISSQASTARYAATVSLVARADWVAKPACSSTPRDSTAPPRAAGAANRRMSATAECATYSRIMIARAGRVLREEGVQAGEGRFHQRAEPRHGQRRGLEQRRADGVEGQAHVGGVEVPVVPHRMPGHVDQRVLGASR